MKTSVLLIIVMLLSSCANTYKIAVEETINVIDYNVFVFRICEKTNKLGTERFYLCDVDCKTKTKALLKEHTIVTEELYLLVSKTTDDVIYLTTKTNRSFDKTPDIFNTEAHEDYILVNDLENVYFGKKTNEGLVFTNKNETLSFYTKPNTKPCKIAITSILSKGNVINEINNVEVVIANIYNVPFEFNLTNRIIAIKVKNGTNYDIVNSIALNKTKVRFNGTISFIEGSKRRRLKYHPRFDKENF